MNELKNKSFLTEWLEKLQQESWQLELLISGFAIYGLFSLRAYLENIMINFLGHQGAFLSTLILITVSIFHAITIIFITNLLIHVLIRGLWIGAIGLRYVSGDIDYEQLKYNQRFTDYFRRKVGSFDKYIENLERFASVIFSYTFLLFFIFFSFFVFIIELLLFAVIFAWVIGGNSEASGFNIEINLDERIIDFVFVILIFVHLFIGLLVALDFLTLGTLKRTRWKWLSAVYFRLYRYISFLTLSFLWRPLLLNFLDSKFTRWLFILAIPYGISISIILPSIRLVNSSYFPRYVFSNEYSVKEKINDKYGYHPRYYEDELERNEESTPPIFPFIIPSKRVKGNLFQVFVSFHKSDDRFVAVHDTSIVELSQKGIFSAYFSGSSPSKELSPRKYEKNLKTIKQLLASSIIFQIDGKVVKASRMECDFYIHPRNEEQGLLCFFPLDSLRVGRHYFTFKKLRVRNATKMTYDTVSTTIPFVYEGN